MRMRKKSNLENRIELCKSYFFNDFDEPLDTRRAIEKKPTIKWSEIFQNDNPICLEIGCGKGGFINEIAKKNPQVNFIAVERITNVIIEAVECTKRENITNLKYLNTCCENLTRYIRESEITSIYLNFSNPLPNNRNEKQRLTSTRFLNLYAFLLKNNGRIFQRTDNKEFFEYSIDQYVKNKNFEIEMIDYDLDSEIKTEHEKKFIELGKSIMGVVAINKKNIIK